MVMMKLPLLEPGKQRFCSAKTTAIILLGMMTVLLTGGLSSRNNGASMVMADEQKDKPTNVICNSKGQSSYNIAGSIYFNDYTYFIVYSEEESQHLVYKLSSENVLPPLNLVLFNNTKLFRMKELFGFDPVLDREDKAVIKSAFGLNGNSIFLLYGSGYVKCDQINLESKERTETSIDDSLVFILNPNNEGSLFMKESNTWKVQDVEFHSSRLWRMEWLFSFTQTVDHRAAVYFVDKPPTFKRPSYVEDIQWPTFSGFRSMENVMTLFVGTNAYIYFDLVVPHQTGPNEDSIHQMTWTKVPLSRYFSCDGSLRNNLDKNMMPKINIKKTKSRSRVITIFTLFGLHFLMATVMLVLILLCSNQSTRTKILKVIGRKPQSNKMVGSGATASNYKRIRKSSRTGSTIVDSASSDSTGTKGGGSATSSGIQLSNSGRPQSGAGVAAQSSNDTRLVVVETPFEYSHPNTKSQMMPSRVMQYEHSSPTGAPPPDRIPSHH